MTGSNMGTITLTTTGTNTIVVLCVINENNGGTQRTVTGVSGGGLTWASRSQVTGADTWISFDTWWALAASPLTSTTITYTLSGTTDDACVVAFGVNGSSNTSAPWDTNVGLPFSANGGGTSVSVSGVSTTTANTFMISFAGDGTSTGSHTYTPVAPFTLIDGVYNGGGSRAACIGVGQNIVSSAQSGITVTSNLSLSVAKLSIIVDAIR